MDSTFLLIISALFRGLTDSLKGAIEIFHVDKILKQRENSKLSPTRDVIRKVQNQNENSDNKKKEEFVFINKVVHCLALNGGCCIASIKLFEYAMIPALEYLFTFCINEEYVLSVIKTTLTCIFQIFWVIPLFMLSKAVNFFWFNDIADVAYKYSSRRKPKNTFSLSKSIADGLFNFLVQVVFIAQSYFLLLFTQWLGGPIAQIGYVLYLLHTCILSSLYSFEYLWGTLGWELHQRLMYIEKNWPYFIGFGVPLTLITSIPDSLVISASLFSVLFPAFILSASKASPVEGACEFRLSIFSLAVRIPNVVLNKLTKWSHVRNAVNRNPRTTKISSGPQTPKGTSSSHFKNR